MRIEEPMPEPTPAVQQHILPPLILHPFTDAAGSLRALEDAKSAARQLHLDGGALSRAEQLRMRLLEGRYAELRMLFFVGKDVFRWLWQCRDYAQRTESLRSRGLAEQSFAEFLISDTPNEVAAKLRAWGVIDYARIFARSIGIQAQFREPPPREILSAEYLRDYYRFADYSYTCWKDSVKFPLLAAGDFTFCLYASGEYAKMLEQQWSAAEEPDGRDPDAIR